MAEVSQPCADTSDNLFSVQVLKHVYLDSRIVLWSLGRFQSKSPTIYTGYSSLMNDVSNSNVSKVPGTVSVFISPQNWRLDRVRVKARECLVTQGGESRTRIGVDDLMNGATRIEINICVINSLLP